MITVYYTTINQLLPKIKKVHPSLSDDDLLNDNYIILQNNSDGRGDYIAKWKHPTLAKPTQSQLDAV